MNHPLRILLIEDHPIFRKALAAFLNGRTEFDIVGQVATAARALDFLRQTPVDLVLSDLHLPDSADHRLVEQLRVDGDDTPLLVLSAEGREDQVLEVIRAGARGYVTKNAAMEELIIAIKALAGGNSYFSKEISANLLLRIGRRNRATGESMNTPSKLTPREWEVLQFIHDELTNREIADRLFISPRTVDTHKRNLIKKLRVKNTVGLVKYYQQAAPGGGARPATQVA